MMTKHSSEISFPHYNFSFSDRSVGKDLPAMQEILVRFLGQEDPLEKG